MANAKKKNIILIVAVVLVMFFIASLASINANSPSAVVAAQTSNDSSNVATGEQGDINIGNIMANGNVPGGADAYMNATYGNSDATKISTDEQLKTFLTSGTGIGYLANNIPDFSWDGRMTKNFMADNITLDGCGYTITMTATNSAASPWIGYANFDDQLKDMYARNSDGDVPGGYFDVEGGLIGYIPSTSAIKNCNFVFTGNINSSTASKESGAGGLIAGYSNGLIDNCSVTFNSGMYIKYTSGASGSQLEQARHSYAFGGFVGAMTMTSGIISNSKITIADGVTIGAERDGDVEWSISHGNVRVWSGGVVGWMANGSKVYNITTAGSGKVKAWTGTAQNPLLYAGIVAGACGVAESGEKDGIIGTTSTAGTVSGIINTWTGVVEYYLDDTQFAPFNEQHNTIGSQVVGVSGNRNSKSSTVSNVYFMYDPLTVNNGKSTVTGYNFATSTCGMEVTRIDIYDYNEATGQYEAVNGTEKAQNAYMIFADTSDSADLLAVYDINLDGGVLWQMEIDEDASDSSPGKVSTYYDKIDTKEEAQKYEITYTQIARNHTTPVSIKYQTGHIVTYKIEGMTAENVLNKGEREYNGQCVEIPQFIISVPDTTASGDTTIYKEVTIPSNPSFWMATKNNNPQPMAAADAKQVGTYEYFVYNGDPETGIDFLDTENRYIAYRADTYKEVTGLTDDGWKTNPTSWQPRIIQTIVPKTLTIDFGTIGDNNSIEYDGNIHQFTAQLNGVVSGETLSANIKYYYLTDGQLGESVIDNAPINAGTYRAVLEGLSDSNYTYDSSNGNPTKDFTITKRQIGFVGKTGYQDGNTFSFVYNGMSQSLQYDILDKESDANASAKNFALFNVLEKDKSVLAIREYVDEGLLDTVNAGTFKTEIVLIDNQNYTIEGDVIVLTINITPADVVLQADEGNVVDETGEIVGVGEKYHQSAFGDSSYTINVVANGVNGESFAVNNMIVYEWSGSEYIDNGTYSFPYTVGRYKIEYIFSNDEFNNYNTNSISVIFVIQKRNVRITFAEDLPSSYIYNGQAQGGASASFSVQAPGSDEGLLGMHAKYAKLEYTFKRADVSPLEDGGNTSLEAIDAGRYIVEVVLTGIQANVISSYNLIYDAPYVFTIEPKPITVAVDNATKVYGEDEPAYTWQYADAENIFYERDNVVLGLTTTCGKMGEVGSYDINLDEANTSGLANYMLTCKSGTLTVNPLAINVSVTVENAQIEYGTTPVLGIQYNDDNRFLSEDVTIEATLEVPVSGIGVYTATATGSYVDNKNYTVTVANATFEVVPKKISFASIPSFSGDGTYVYTGQIIAPELANVEFAQELVGDDVVNVVFDYYQGDVQVSAVNVGIYKAVISGVDNANYTLVVEEGQQLPSPEFEIVKRDVSIIVNDGTREYGLSTITSKSEDGAKYTYASESLQFADSDITSGRLVIEYVTDVPATSEIKDYADSLSIAISGEAAGNYNLTIAQKATLTITGSLISSLELAASSTVYDGTNQISKIKANVAEGTTGFNLVVTTDAEGMNVVNEVVNAGTYYVTFSAVEGGQFSGEPKTVEFVVNKAERKLNAEDIKITVNFNKLTFECAYENMQYSINDSAFLKQTSFDAQAMTEYKVVAKAGESDNYLESNEVEITVKTGANPASIISFLNSYDKVDFSNLTAYKTMLAQLELIGEDDMASIDMTKVNALKESYEELLQGASEVIGDAQEVAGKASGMSAKGKISLALSSLGVGLAGIMLGISARKNKKEDKKDDKKMSRLNKKSIIKTMTVVIVLVMIMSIVLVGCKKKEFTQNDLFNLASFKTQSNEKSKDVVITVNSGSEQIYKYDNGEETFLEGLNPDGSFSLSGAGTGFDFKAEYFENISFTNSDGTAKFTADIKDVKSFLGVDATNAKVEVTADTNGDQAKLNNIKVTYNTEKNGTSYSVNIEVTLNY